MPVSYTHLDVYKRQELDSAREVVSRKLKDLERQGYLKLGRGKIQIEKDLSEIIK